MKKHLAIIVGAILAMAVITGCAVPDPSQGSGSQTKAAETDYGGNLFDTSKVHTIDIRIDPKDWDDLLERPLEKIKYKTDITIDGEETKNVSCATKGNSSLISARKRFDNDRYSLKLDFGKFEKEQRFHGIRKLNLNNSFADPTYMKDHLCYTMFRRAGVDAPLCSYAWVTVNYVEKDPTAFYSAEQFLPATDTLKQFCLLRAESIRRQLDGMLPADTQDQSADDRADASALDMKIMS